jgi:hypothetical protein
MRSPDFRQPCQAFSSKRYAEFVETPTQLIHLRPELDEQRARSVQAKHRLLILRLGCNRTHSRLLHGSPYCFGVRCVGLIRLYEWPDELDVQQHCLLPERLNHTSLPMSASAGLERHSTITALRQSGRILLNASPVRSRDLLAVAPHDSPVRRPLGVA